MTGDEALAALIARENPERAARQAASHKAPRRYLGLETATVEALVAEWRAALDIAGRVALAETLWRADIFEARIAAAKLLTQARIAEDGAVWAAISRWVPDFDCAAIADRAAAAGARRLAAAPERLDEAARWTEAQNPWTRRAALTFALPWARMRRPGAEDAARRERILGWAETLIGDRDRLTRKTVAAWLRTLAKHDPDRARAFLAAHGDGLNPRGAGEAP